MIINQERFCIKYVSYLISKKPLFILLNAWLSLWFKQCVITDVYAKAFE